MSKENVLLSSTSDDGILTLTINRPKQGNSVNDYVYEEIIKQLNFAEKEDKVKVVLLTGSEFRAFCAGADLAAGFDPLVGPLKTGKGSYHDPVGRFMSRIISFGKPLIAAVNGLAVGVGMTILPHCDVVYSVPHATFETPFTKIGVCPEFCSSVLFPKIFGPSLAGELLYFGKKLTAQEAKEGGLVSEIIPAKTKEEFLEKVYMKIQPSLTHPNSGRSMKLFKQLIRNPAIIHELEIVHRTEMALLDARSTGPNSEAAQGVAAFKALQQKKSSKL